MRTSASVTVLLSALAASGCASSSFAPNATYYGEHRSTRDTVERAADMRYSDAEGVEVMVGKLPDGVSLKGTGFEVDEDRYELLGMAKATSNGPDTLGFWFYDYDESESWRGGFCY